jgi:LacI family transcriptional regulator
MAKRMTSRDLAALAGVSQATVSRVIRGRPNVTDATRDKVLKALEESGYVPNASARSLRTHSTGVIGVVVGRITNPFYPELLDALSREIGAQGFRMSLWVADDGGELGAFEAIRQRSLDGTIYTTVTADSSSLKLAVQQDSPVVLVNRTLEDLQCAKVSSDNPEGGARVAEHLVRFGHKRIALLMGPPEVSTGSERAQGFTDALRRHRLEVDKDLRIVGEFSHAFGYSAMETLMQMPDPPTAIFCVNDAIAFGALDGARAAGIDVPGRVSVVGYDDVEMAGWEAFNLTTVRQPTAEMARLGVSALVERIQHPDHEYRHERIPSQLIVRRSTGPAPG